MEGGVTLQAPLRSKSLDRKDSTSEKRRNIDSVKRTHEEIVWLFFTNESDVRLLNDDPPAVFVQNTLEVGVALDKLVEHNRATSTLEVNLSQ